MINPITITIRPGVTGHIYRDGNRYRYNTPELSTSAASLSELMTIIGAFYALRGGLS